MKTPLIKESQSLVPQECQVLAAYRDSGAFTALNGCRGVPLDLSALCCTLCDWDLDLGVMPAPSGLPLVFCTLPSTVLGRSAVNSCSRVALYPDGKLPPSGILTAGGET